MNYVNHIPAESQLNLVEVPKESLNNEQFEPHGNFVPITEQKKNFDLESKINEIIDNVSVITPRFIISFSNSDSLKQLVTKENLFSPRPGMRIRTTHTEEKSEPVITTKPNKRLNIKLPSTVRPKQKNDPYYYSDDENIQIKNCIIQ